MGTSTDEGPCHADTGHSLDPMHLEHSLRVHELVDLCVLEAVLAHDVAGVLAAKGRRAPDAFGRVREVDCLAEVLEAADLGVLLVHDQPSGVHLWVVVDVAPEVVVTQLARHAEAVEGREGLGA